MAIGIKSGYPGYGALNLKKFMGSDNALDFLIGSNFSGSSKYLWGQVIFELNRNIRNGSGTNWYYGAGPSVGFYTAGGYSKHGKSFSGMWGGVTGVIGIEHTFSALPLNLAIEAGPYLNLFPAIYVDGQINVAVRYAIQ